VPAGAAEEAEQQAEEEEAEQQAEEEEAGPSAAASRPTRVWRLQGGMLWLDREVGGGPAVGAGPASDSEPSRSEVGSVCRDSWLEDERGPEGSRPPVAVEEVRSDDEWRLP